MPRCVRPKHNLLCGDKCVKLVNPATKKEVFFIVNATELRLSNFAMDPVTPPPVAPRPGVQTRRARVAAVLPDTSGRKFRLPADVENQILALCW